MFFCSCSSFLFIKISIAGKVIKAKNKDIAIPVLIIRPRFITGSIFDKTSEPKPITVVIIAKNEGLNFDNTVLIISLYWLAFLYFTFNSLYLTIKCKTIEIVIINCNAIKFEDITVTSQPNNPKSPAVETTEIKHINRGKIIHLRCLKIYQRTNIKIASKPEP